MSDNINDSINLNQLLKEKKNLFLIDGFGLVFRAYYALIKSRFQTSRGEPTSIIFGVMKTLLKIVKDYAPHYMIFALESKTPTKRKQLYKDYKANRETPPEDLKVQIEPLINMIESFNITTISRDGFEADDIIASISKHYRNNDELNVFIVSNDKDLLQLVGDNVYILRYAKGMDNLEVFDREQVKKKMSLYPEQILDYLALTGDSSDNIPGVRGVGEKTALKLISHFKSFEQIYKQIQRVTPMGVRAKLMKHEEDALMSYKLVELMYDADIDYNLKNFESKGLSSKEGINLLKRYELHSLLKDEYFVKNSFEKNTLVDKDDKNFIETFGNDDSKKGEYFTIRTKAALEQVIKQIKSKAVVCIDLETDSEDPIYANIVGVALCTEPFKAYYIPCNHLNFGDLLAKMKIKITNN